LPLTNNTGRENENQFHKKKQYETLLKAVYLGNWMVNSTDDEPEGNQFNELEEYICSFAKDFGLKEYVVYDERDKVYYPSRMLEEDEEVDEYIECYDDYTFWDNLTSSLAGRDMVNEYGEEAIKKMSDMERFTQKQPFVERYDDEFAKNGLKNLVIAGAAK
jgi:hypothetical protein